MKKTYVLVHDTARRLAVAEVQKAPDGVVVKFSPPNRTLEQSAKFHAICGDIAKTGMEWFGKRRTEGEWKVLLVSGHAKATGMDAEVVPGLEGELVNLRESTALMSKPRSASLIEYTLAFCANNGIRLSEPERIA